MKAKVGMAVLAVLLIISVAGNFVLYAIWTNETRKLKADNASLQENITSLQSQVTSLQSQVSNLQTQVDDLEWENQQLVSENEQLATENTELKAADLGLIDTWWEDNHPLLGSPYVHVYGTVVNFGQETAHNVVVTVKIYEQAVLLKTENISLEDIYGEWYGKFDVNIEYSGDATSVEPTVSWT